MDLTSGRAWRGPRNDLSNAWTFDRPGPSLWRSLSPRDDQHEAPANPWTCLFDATRLAPPELPLPPALPELKQLLPCKLRRVVLLLSGFVDVVHLHPSGFISPWILI
ncbi:hypothetical protein CGCA056_v013664 [Colletotrichum aenigma]|uniref:uncharacterized protein n=1 Tax=Colletotrichum aenigma TaxID=1215731 RepID=UPI0018725FA9|nr:uncharacterized protein CGCA056_v013664 [Colletotrichum aenigma]KAF5506932.1 hypothetical protein CGCA056_v013664 [Colletotrichum aenigma]